MKVDFKRVVKRNGGVELKEICVEQGLNKNKIK